MYFLIKVSLSARVTCDDDTWLFNVLRRLDKTQLLLSPKYTMDITTGAIVALMAFERYVAICLPFNYETILSDAKRRVMYSILVMYYVLLLLFYTANFILSATVREINNFIAPKIDLIFFVISEKFLGSNI